MTDSARVSFSESLEVKGRKVGEMLQELRPHLLLANCAGLPPFGPREAENYGFLVKGSEEKSKERVLGCLWRKKLRHLIGVLYLKDKERQTTHKKWLLEVYGRENIISMTDLAERLAEKFEVEVHVRLSSEHHQLEYWSDDV